MKNYFVYVKHVSEIGSEEPKLNLTFLCLVSNCASVEQARDQVITNLDEETMAELVSVIEAHEDNGLVITEEDNRLVKETLPEIIRVLETKEKNEEEESMLEDMKKIAEKLANVEETKEA